MGFWVGSWECEWDGGRGENLVEPILGGGGLLERFRSADGFEGVSVSLFDRDRQVWRQSWADTTGTWIHLSGGPVGDDVVLVTDDEPTGPERRMVFSEIRDRSFRWTWQAAAASGRWTTRWEIRYRRR